MKVAAMRLTVGEKKHGGLPIWVDAHDVARIVGQSSQTAGGGAIASAEFDDCVARIHESIRHHPLIVLNEALQGTLVSCAGLIFRIWHMRLLVFNAVRHASETRRIEKEAWLHLREQIALTLIVASSIAFREALCASPV
jgi:hypothetical protein